MSRSVAIIAFHNSLAAAGLRHLLDRHFDVPAIVVDCQALEAQATRVEAQYIFVDTQTFVAHLEFLLPRRAAVIIADKQPHPDNFSTLDVAMSESDLIDRLNNLISTRPSTEQKPHELSQRELDVLRQIVAGKINKEIAADLGISLNTVLTHRKNITAKLGIKSVSGLSFYALMNNLV